MSTPSAATKTEERQAAKTQEAGDLEAINKWVRATPSDKLTESTSRIMIGLARAQHKVPSTVDNLDPTLISMVKIEDQARKLETKKLNDISPAISVIKDDINRISPESREVVRIKSNFENDVKTIQTDYKTIAERQDKFRQDLTHSLKKKNEILGEVAKTIGQGQTPDPKALPTLETDLRELAKESKTLDKDAGGFYYKVDSLKTQVSNVVQSIEGPTQKARVETRLNE